MYSKIVNCRVKIVFVDGTKINVIYGTVKEYSEDLKTISIIKDDNQHVFISALQIQKLEIQEQKLEIQEVD